MKKELILSIIVSFIYLFVIALFVWVLKLIVMS